MRYLETQEEILNYIERSNITDHAQHWYGITGLELNVFFDIVKSRNSYASIYDALCLAYHLGMARGYRAAKNGK